MLKPDDKPKAAKLTTAKMLPSTLRTLRLIAAHKGLAMYVVLHDLVEREWKKINRGGK